MYFILFFVIDLFKWAYKQIWNDHKVLGGRGTHTFDKWNAQTQYFMRKRCKIQVTFTFVALFRMKINNYIGNW